MIEKNQEPGNPGVPSDAEMGPTVLGRLSSAMELAARSGAVLFVLIYGTGFLIVSLHHAAYGIAQFDLLKPRVFSAGVLFVFLTAIPLIAAANVFSIFADRMKHGPQKWYWWCRRILFYAIACVGLTILSFNMLEPIKGGNVFDGISFLVGLVFACAIAASTHEKEERRPIACLVLTLLSLGLLAIGAVQIGDNGVRSLFGWYFFVGVACSSIADKLRDPNSRKAIEWEKWLLYCLAVISLYSVFLFDRIRAHFGGGSPVPVIAVFAEKVPLLNVDSKMLFLIDETDHGFYLLESRQSRRAIFVRRDLVKGIVFQTEPLKPLIEAPNE